MGTWERVALGAIILVILFWQFPKISAALEASKDAEKDWGGLLWPIVFVVAFVVVLISLV